MANNNVNKKQEQSPEVKEYMSVREVAELSGCSYGTVKRGIEQGRLAAYRIGRKFFIKTEDAAAYAQTQRGRQPAEGYTIRELMSKLSLSYAFVSDLIKSGELKSRKIGRQYVISKQDFQDFMEKKRL